MKPHIYKRGGFWYARYDGVESNPYATFPTICMIARMWGGAV